MCLVYYFIGAKGVVDYDNVSIPFVIGKIRGSEEKRWKGRDYRVTYIGIMTR